jgi:hypothetical protein
MVRFVMYAGICSWLATASVSYAEEGIYIEQELVYKMVVDQSDMKGKQQIWFTNNYIRNKISFGEKTSIAIFDLKASDIILISPEEEQYIQMKLEDYQRIVSMRLLSEKILDVNGQPELVQTEEQKKIGEWDCSKMVYKQLGEVPIKVEMWVSQDTVIRFSDFLMIMERLGMKIMLGRLSEFVSALPGYPVETTVEQSVKGQKQVSKIRVVRIIKGPVDPALFKIPEGYRRIQEDKLTHKPKTQRGQ